MRCPRRTRLTRVAFGVLIAAAVTAAPARAATFTVTTTSDAGFGSLRAAVAFANATPASDTIVVPASPTPIILTSGELDVAYPVTVVGSGSASTKISGNSSSRIFNVSAPVAVTITGVTLTAGRSTGYGGAVDAVGGKLTLQDVVASQNTAMSGGGAVSIGGNGSSNDTLVISESSFSENRAMTYSGGAVSSGGGGSSNDTVTITSSLFTANSAGTSGDGGAVAASGGGGNTDTTTITNTTVVGNSASGASSDGGGLSLGGKTVRLFDDTIVANTASGGGGIYVPATAVLANTIVAGNHSDTPARENCAFPASSGGHNIDSGTGCGFTGPGDRTGTDPLLGPLQDNGGPTRSLVPLPGSPAVDGGTTTVGPAVDQRGLGRPQGAAGDIGAVEVATPSAGTDPVSDVTMTSAVAHGSAQHPGVGAGTVRFEYGTSTAYGAQTPAQPLAAGAPTAAFSAAITGLPPGTLVHVRTVAANSDRTTFGPDQTFQTVAAPAISPPPVTGPPTTTPPTTQTLAPSLSALTLSPRGLVAAPGRGPSVATTKKGTGTTITYRDTQAATTTATVERALRGYRVGSGCTAKRPRKAQGTPRRCTRYVTVGSFTHVDVAGVNRLHFTGRIKARALAVGSYRLSAVARGRTGLKSRTLRAGFTVVRRR